MSILENRCGLCTLCCKLTAVPELKKPLGVWCDNCNVNSGCKIYVNRPPSCKNFKCVWYRKENLLPELRPDICGVIFEKLIGISTYLALVSSEMPDAWLSPIVLESITNLLKSGAVVVIIIEGKTDKYILLPYNKTKEEAIIEINSVLPKYNL